MSVGTGIFLSAVVLAIVILYGITKDRWAWRRVAKQMALVCFAIFAVGAAAIVGHQFWENLPTKLSQQSEYAGLRLGMTQDEVMYIKGYPPSVLVEDLKDPQWKGFYTVVDTKKLEQGKRAKDYRFWSYEEYKHRINITFNEARTAVVVIQCYSDDKLSRCPAVGGVRDGDSENDALRKVGTPSESQLQGVTKTLKYGDLGITLTLTKEQIYIVAIGDPRHRER